MKYTLIALVLCCTATAAAAQQSAEPTQTPRPSSTPPVVQNSSAQAPSAQGGPQAAPVAQTPRLPSLAGPGNMPLPNATNIRLVLTITDNFTGAPVKKTVSMLIAQNSGGQVRTSASSSAGGYMNVDALAAAYQAAAVVVKITFDYQGSTPKDGPLANQRPATISESITVVLQDGKPMIVTESADPGSDRKVTVELTATILK